MIDSFISYKKAIEFEFNQELLYKNLFKVSGKSTFIPRSFVYKEFFIKYASLIDLIYWPLVLVWNILLQPVFSTYIFIKLLRNSHFITFSTQDIHNFSLGLIILQLYYYYNYARPYINNGIFLLHIFLKHFLSNIFFLP
jgi:hypothetical protein